jgi:glycosyltransferase involved in cell wall biosynthesis
MKTLGTSSDAKKVTADVTFLLEGTYPYVRGGVSTWIHQLLRGLPDLRFSLVFIGGSRERRGPLVYELPPNVVHLEELYLATPRPTEPPRQALGDPAFFAASAKMHDAFRAGAPAHHDILEEVFEALVQNPERCRRDFLYSQLSWQEMTSRYEASAPTRSFLEYFWSLRSMHAPLFNLAAVAARLPPTKMLHVVSTGFAGFLASLLKRQRKVPLLLTEHGIYTKERRIELLQADWIFDDARIAPDTEDISMGFFRQLWIRFFEQLGRMTYDAADDIVTLYEGNRQRQIADGAPADRTRVLPNGIALGRFAALRAHRAPETPLVMALIGRVVPIKDIKTFVRAAKIVLEALPQAEAWVVGPEEEDPTYARDCRELARTLGASDRIKFLGFQKIDDLLPRVGVNVLTSISEAQPLVVLEGFAAGIPCVATDVGCCRELIEGRDDTDRALGSAGEIVRISDPAATAQAVLNLLRSETAWKSAQKAGMARVERFYTDDVMLAQYRAMYQVHTEPSQWPA